MIIVQTPLRISLLGGGTDFPAFYREEGGCVLSSSIDKYIFITIKKRFDELVRVGYTRTEMVTRLDDLQHELIREALRLTGINAGIEVTTMGDIPSEGVGLGSSSTVTVGALHAMYTYLGELVTADQLAREACQIEIDTLGKPIGVQDQYIVAYGGLRFITFDPDGGITAERVPIAPDLLTRLNAHLMLFYTGVTRHADTILREQKANVNQRRPVLRELRDMARSAHDALIQGNLNELGHLLDASWQRKKQLASNISNETFDEYYRQARRAGALGGKISGAGGGGFFLLYCPPERRNAVRAALAPLRELPFRLEHDGSKVIFNYPRS